jgi:hypothetical protein
MHREGAGPSVRVPDLALYFLRLGAMCQSLPRPLAIQVGIYITVL